MTKEQKPSRLKSIIGPLEQFLFFSSIVLMAIHYFQVIESDTLLIINLIGLAVTFFISAFLPIELFDSQQEADEHGQITFIDLLVSGIIPKVIWISSSVSLFGLILYITKPELGTYINMALISGLTLITGLAVIGFGNVSGGLLHKSLNKVILRGIVALAISGFLLFAA